MNHELSDPQVGGLIDGRYEITARLARGGMSTVYTALDTRLDRQVALKVLYPHLAEDPTLVERFEREAKTAARLSHPHVVNVYDQGVDVRGDTPLAYLAMEYVPGVTLRQVISSHAPMEPERVWKYLRPVVDGLAAAHRAGLVHRDVKPENVLVSPEGAIKVADFGLARAATQHTGTHAAILGTVAYISPELLSGEKADQRSDVYALGILAFEMLTGKQPFTGKSAVEVAMQHTTSRVPAPSSVVPHLPEAVDELVVHCTEPNPQDRPQDASQVLSLIDQIATSFTREVEDQRTMVINDLQETRVHTTVPPPAPEPASFTEEPPVMEAPRVTRLPTEDNILSVPATREAPEDRSEEWQAPQKFNARRANRPTHTLRKPQPVKFLLVAIAVLMLAAAALLAGTWAGTMF